jgi:hypothetical protein
MLYTVHISCPHAQALVHHDNQFRDCQDDNLPRPGAQLRSSRLTLGAAYHP